MRLKSCLENWGILPGFLVVCGRDVQRDPQRRAQVFATALNMYLCPHLSLINLIAQIKRQLEWCVLAKKAGEEGKPIAAQIHLAASGGFQKSMHPLLKSQEMQAFSCHGRYLQTDLLQPSPLPHVQGSFHHALVVCCSSAGTGLLRAELNLAYQHWYLHSNSKHNCEESVGKLRDWM